MGLNTKIDWLTDCQLQCDFDFEDSSSWEYKDENRACPSQLWRLAVAL
jgi:hypothetical protein